MSKDLFLLMREQEIATDNFLPTKREIQTSSKQFAKKLIDEGLHNPQELLAQALRLKEALTVIEAEGDFCSRTNSDGFGIAKCTRALFTGPRVSIVRDSSPSSAR